MLDGELWRTEPNGALATDTDEFRLVVRQVNGSAQFLVLRHPRQDGSCPAAILASGTEASVRAAMAAAGRSAARLSARDDRAAPPSPAAGLALP